MRLYKLSINETDYDVLIKEVTPEEVVAEVNGELKTVRIRDIENLSKASKSEPVFPGVSQQRTPTAHAAQPKTAKKSGGTGVVSAPIPGQIYSINVSVGDKVLAGQKVLILEAMKMENVITANCDGVIDQILVKVGDAVEQNQQLVIIKE